MSYEIPETEPAQVFAGDTVKWIKYLSDYPPSDGWTLNYALKKNGIAPIVVSSSASGSSHLVSVPSATSGAWAAGDYVWQSYVTHADGSRHTIAGGDMTILASLSASASGYDPRSHAKIVLDAIRLTIQGQASKAQLSYKVGDRELRYMSPRELIEWESYYEEKVQAEEDAKTLENGGAVRNYQVIRFINPE